MIRRVLFMTSLAACGSTNSPDVPSGPDAFTPTGSHVQMNDLSVLFPLPTSSELAGALAASTPARGGALLPFWAFGGDPNSVSIMYDDLRAVAFRLDPCFGHLGPITDPTSCQPQLRVVFQPIFNVQGQTLASDQAVHAFYALTSDEVVEAVRAVIAARVANGGTTDLGPLAPHPIVAAQGLSGPMGTSLASIITHYAGAANLVRFTTLDLTPVSGDIKAAAWTFHGFDLSGGNMTPMVIPKTKAPTTQSFLTASTGPLEAQVSPLTSSGDDISVLASARLAAAATTPERFAAFEAALRIENPAFNSPNTIDCASCHAALPARQLVGEKIYGFREAGNANAFTADPSIPSADLQLTTSGSLVDPGAHGLLNVHAFSYRNTDPMINARVVNETAANLVYFESQGLGYEAPPPSSRSPR